MKTIKVKTSADIPQNYTGIVVYSGGIKEWHLNGLVHREEGPCTECKDCHSGNFELCSKPGPAVVFPNGEKRWFLNGKCRREDGPAAICADGGEYWLLNDKLHREEGPAVVYPDGKKRWYLNGKEVDKKTVELYYMLKYRKVLDL